VTWSASVVVLFGAIGFAIVIVLLLAAANTRVALTLNVKVSNGTANGDAVVGLWLTLTNDGRPVTLYLISLVTSTPCVDAGCTRSWIALLVHVV
jgi:ribosomal protein S12 methylthiotransferase accessory factor YcaO